jgi:hypothetical protein
MGKNIKALAIALLALGLYATPARAVNCPALQFASGINPLVCGTPAAGSSNTFREAAQIYAHSANTGPWTSMTLVLNPGVGVTPTYVNSGTITGATTASSVAVAAPAAIVAGNYLFAFVTNNNQCPAVAAIPAGWNVGFEDMNSQTGTGEVITFLWKKAAAGDVGAASYTFTNATNTGCTSTTIVGVIHQYQNIDATNPIIDARYHQSGANGYAYEDCAPVAGAFPTNSVEACFIYQLNNGGLSTFDTGTLRNAQNNNGQFHNLADSVF